MDIQDLTQLPRTRQEAINLGSKYYFTSIKCSLGHISKRYANDCHCFECKKHYAKIVKENNPERQKIYNKNYNINNKEIVKNRDKLRRQKNREKANEYYRNWYKENKEKALLRAKEWRDKNIESSRSIVLNRISRKKNAEGTFSKKDILIKKELQNNECVYCKCDVSVSYHVDHITPLYKGGSNWPDNLQILCPSCNCSKGAKTHDEFIEFLQKQKSVVASV